MTNDTPHTIAWIDGHRVRIDVEPPEATDKTEWLLVEPNRTVGIEGDDTPDYGRVVEDGLTESEAQHQAGLAATMPEGGCDVEIVTRAEYESGQMDAKELVTRIESKLEALKTEVES